MEQKAYAKALETNPESFALKYSEYQHLTARAIEVFGDQLEAVRWLSTQSRDFNNRSPLQELASQGPDHVLSVLGKIEHGVFF